MAYLDDIRRNMSSGAQLRLHTATVKPASISIRNLDSEKKG
jgi:hypothetical protein